MKIYSETTQIGFIGTGVMGRSMASHLIDAGFTTHIFTRTKERARELLQKGAHWHDSPGEVAKAADVIITIVGYPADVREVYLGEEGILRHCRKGSLLIDMTTSSPRLAVEIYEKARAANVKSLDAPVSGGDIGAREARLSIMVGGDRDAFDDARPLFEIMGQNIVYQGGAGAGQHCKLANQIAIASTMIGMCEAVRYAEKSGLDPETVLRSIETGAAGSWSLSNLAPRIIKGDFSSGFFVKHFIKDMDIALESCDEIHLDARGLQLARSLYGKLAEEGGQDYTTQALYKLY
jgi:3-hydroxyisobutyrate dehydrogenase